jgi:hypothetical protein
MRRQADRRAGLRCDFRDPGATTPLDSNHARRGIDAMHEMRMMLYWLARGFGVGVGCYVLMTAALQLLPG